MTNNNLLNGVVIGFKFTDEFFVSTPYYLRQLSFQESPRFDYSHPSKYEAILESLSTLPFSDKGKNDFALISAKPGVPIFFRDLMASITFSFNISPLQRTLIIAFAKLKGINNFYELEIDSENNLSPIPFKFPKLNRPDECILTTAEIHQLFIEANFHAYLVKENTIRYKKNHGSRVYAVVSPAEISVGWQGLIYDSMKTITLQQAKKLIAFTSDTRANNKKRQFRFRES